MTRTQTPIAIVGMGVLFPGSPDLHSYWSNLSDARDAITDVPPHRWDPRYYEPHPAGPRRADQVYCRRGGFVDELAVTEPERFGIAMDVAEAIDPEQLLGLQVAAAAVDDAGGAGRLGDPGRVGVILGRGGYLSPGLVRQDQRVRTARQLVHTLGTLMPSLARDDLERVRVAFTDALGPEPAQSTSGLLPNLVASRIADQMNLRGPAYTIDAACASSLVAVDAAITELASGRCDAVLAGGIHHCHDITLWSLFSQLGAVSPSQQSRPFHRDADGLLLSEGTGIVVLKRLADAQTADDRIYAVIRGSGVSSDGRSAAELTGQAPAGQVLALERAWAAAGLDPRDPASVGLLEAHGAATAAGDGAELATLAQVFGPATSDGVAVIGSVKSMIGHAMPAAGVAGLVKAALAVHRGVLLPTLNCEEPHPAMDGTRFHPLPAAIPWVSTGPRRAGVNAFGFGGVNAHVILEEAPDAGRATSRRAPTAATAAVREPERVLRFAAATPEALIESLEGDDATLRRRGVGLPTYRGPGSRLGLVGPTERRLAVARKVANGARGGGWAAWRGRNDVWLSSEPLLAEGGRTAFLFPGLEAEFGPRIDDVAEHFGLALPELTADGIGQQGSAVMRIGRVLERALRRMRVVPDVLGGHSLGEWSAMFASGMFSETDADALIFGPTMADLGALDVDYASLACSAEQAVEAIVNHPEVVLSHDNAPRQAIVCGPPDAIRALAAEQRQKNVLVQILPFRSGFHTPLLSPYVEEIGRSVAKLPIRGPAQTELWSATLVGHYPETPEEIRALFLRHLVEPVRFRTTIEAMYEAGVRVFIQVGQGRLGALVDDTLGFYPHLTIAANTARRSGLDQLRRLAVALWVEGGDPDFAALGPAESSTLTGETDTDTGTGTDTGAPAQPWPRLRLDLGTGFVTLDPSLLPAPVGVIPAEDTTGLRGWARRDPIAHELLELLTDTARTAVAVLDGKPATAGARPLPAGPVEETGVNLRVDLDTMPYLVDHCLVPQQPGWPEPSDRRPVVPATTIVHLLTDLVERVAPGRVAVELTDVRFERWLLAAPATDLRIDVRPVDDDTVAVSFGEFASATVRLARGYPGSDRPLWPHAGAGEDPPAFSAADLYAQRYMFHGPRFQSVVSIIGHSDTHVRAVLTPTTAPGSLLDGAGQLLGYFARVNLSDGYVLFPTAIEKIELFGPEPKAGTPVSALVWVPRRNSEWLQAHLQLVADGRVWAEVTGWLDRRFQVRPETDEAFRFPERHLVGRQMPGDWTLVCEAWSDLATREMFADRYLGAAERAELRDQPPRGRQQWLLGRLAVKDAVRSRLWDAGHGTLYPAQLRVSNTANGAPSVAGERGLELPDLAVSLAHSGEVAVAVVRPRSGAGGRGVGIDVEEVRDHPRSTVDAALTPDEQTLLDDLVRDTGLSAARWFARFWTAKEAAAKSLGTGLGGAPRRFVVGRGDATVDRLVVTVPSGEALHIRLTEVSNPPHLAQRDYVVAWTSAPGTDAHPGDTP